MPRTLAALLPLLAITTACGGGGAGTPVATPSNIPTDPVAAPPTIAGSYRAPHTVMMVCSEGEDGWCEESVEDAMTVTDTGADRIDVSIELVQTNGHTCTFAGSLTLDPRADTRRWTHHSVDELEGTCDLTLEQSATDLTLTSEGCRYYCGARASLDATFPYPPTST